MPFQDICYIWKKQVIILKQLRSSRKDKKRERTPLQERPAGNWQRDTGETFPLLRSNLVGPNSNRCTVHCTVEQRFLLATLTLAKTEEYNVAMTVVGGKSKSRCKLIPSLHLAALRCANAALVAVISWKYPSFIFNVTLLVEIQYPYFLNTCTCTYICALSQYDFTIFIDRSDHFVFCQDV